MTLTLALLLLCAAQNTIKAWNFWDRYDRLRDVSDALAGWCCVVIVFLCVWAMV